MRSILDGTFCVKDGKDEEEEDRFAIVVGGIDDNDAFLCSFIVVVEEVVPLLSFL